MRRPICSRPPRPPLAAGSARRPSRLGQLRRRQADHGHRADRDVEIREPARDHHGARPDKVWTVTLAPTSRMINRGATADMVAVGKTVSAYGYASTVEKDEMRAERITVDGKTVEMR